MKINNRAFVFKLKLHNPLCGIVAGSEVLLVYGLGKEGAIKGVKDLEKSSGLTAVALLCNGGAHHLQIEKWYKAFPEMKVWVCPTKVPQTDNGIRLRREYPGRWELVDNTSFAHHVNQLLFYFGSGQDMQVDCIIFNQFNLYQDKTSQAVGIAKDATYKDENTSLGFFSFLNGYASLAADLSCPIDDVVFYHKPTRMIITGHHFEFVYVPHDHVFTKEFEFEGNFFIRYVMPKLLFSRGRYASNTTQTVIRIRDFKIHAAQWQEVMKWDFGFACSHHDPPGVCGPLDNGSIMNGKGGVKGHIVRELVKTGELAGEADAGSWFPWRCSNLVHRLEAKEAARKKLYGPFPPLPFGGPGYNEIGLKVE